MTSMLFLHIALVALLFAQDNPTPPPVHAFGCGGPDQPERTDLIEKPSVQFTVVAPPADRERWMHRAFRGFDEHRYGFSSIAFFFHPVPTTGYAGHWGDDESKITAMELFVRVADDTTKKEIWYRLENSDTTDPRGEGLLFIQPLDKEGTESDATESAVPHDALDDWMTLELATPDPQLPLFSLTDDYNDHGANAGGVIENNLLIDLRSGKPVMRAAAQCIRWDGGGACTAPDTTAVHYQHVLCTWDPKETDFLCTDTGPWGGSYNPVNAKRQFLLLQEKEPAQLSWAPDALPTLHDFVTKFRRNTSAHALVRGVGYVDLIWRSDSMLPQRQVLLLASPGAGDEQNTHFTLAIVSNDGTASLVDVPKWGIAGEESDEIAAPPRFTPSDTNRTVTASEFAQVNGAHLLKVVDTLKSGSNIHVVYLVGIQAKESGVVSNAVRLASEGTTYMGCGFEGADSTSLTFRWDQSEHAAAVRVQPQETNSMDDQPKACAWEGKLRWVDGVGFRVRKTRDLCSLKAQDVTIDDHGRIASKPRPESPQ